MSNNEISIQSIYDHLASLITDRNLSNNDTDEQDQIIVDFMQMHQSVLCQNERWPCFFGFGDGISIIDAATKYNLQRTFNFLNSQSQNILAYQNDNNEMCLLRAIKYRSFDIYQTILDEMQASGISRLLRAKALCNIDCRGNSILIEICKIRNLDILSAHFNFLRICVSPAEQLAYFNQENEDGFKAAHFATANDIFFRKFLRITKIICHAARTLPMATLSSQRNKRAIPLIHFCILKKYENALEQLIVLGFDPNVKYKGKTALEFLAVGYKNASDDKRVVFEAMALQLASSSKLDVNLALKEGEVKEILPVHLIVRMKAKNMEVKSALRKLTLS